MISEKYVGFYLYVFFHRKSQWIPQENPQMSVASPQVASFLLHCQDASGGFAGGPQQLPHLAPTYAAVSALMVAGTEEAYKVPPVYIYDHICIYGLCITC